MKADGSGVTQLTTGGGTFPGWSPDGKWIAYRHANGTTHVLRWDGSGDKKVCDGEFLFWMHDNSGLVCGKSEKYYLVKPNNGTSSLLFKKSDFTRLGTEKFVPGGITHDGKYLLAFSGRYKGGFQGDNGVFGSTSLGVGHNSAIILDLNNKGKIYFFGYGCEPTTPPAGGWIYHVRGDKQHATYPDLYKMKMADLMSRSSYQGEMEHADADWGHEYFPRISNDNTWMVYGATTGCHEHATCDYEVFIHRLGAGYKNRTRLTQHKGNDTWPSLYVGSLWQPPKPKITLSSTSLSFKNEQGQADPANQQVAVSNGGGGTLATIKPSITYGGKSGWLAVKVSGSGDKQTLTNSVTTAGLPPNTYVANVVVTATGATNSPQSYSVTLTVTAKPSKPDDPTIALTPTTLGFAASTDSDPPPQSIAITNSGAQTLGAVTTKTSYLTGTDWLVVQPSGSGNDQSLLNSVVVAGLAPNTYSAVVEVTAAGASNNPQSYSVTLTVTSVPDPETLHLKINSNGTAVSGWVSEEPYRTGGTPYTFKDDDVVLDEASDPAPAEVYATCIHHNHSYSFPIPNGKYRVRLHFYDTSDTVRKMDYTIEGEKVLDDFSITAEVGKGKALIEEFTVDVSDGNGLQIVADQDQGNDVFESAIEIIGVPTSTPDAGATVPPDGGVATDTDPQTDHADQTGQSAQADQTTMSGGCSIVPTPLSWPLLVLLSVYSVARRRRTHPTLAGRS